MLLLLLLEVLHNVLRILGDLARGHHWPAELKGAEAAIRGQGVGLQRPPLGTHFVVIRLAGATGACNNALLIITYFKLFCKQATCQDNIMVVHVLLINFDQYVFKARTIDEIGLSNFCTLQIVKPSLKLSTNSEICA